jgi:hypothetical protein
MLVFKKILFFGVLTVLLSLIGVLVLAFAGLEGLYKVEPDQSAIFAFLGYSFLAGFVVSALSGIALAVDHFYPRY